MENEDDVALEKLLRTLRLRAPSNQLDARLESIFVNADLITRRRLRLIPLAVAAGIAIVAALPAIWILRTPSRPPVAFRTTVASPTTENAASNLTVRIERDETQIIEDIIAVEDNTPYRQTRRRTVHDVWYIDPQTHARLLIRTPTEQVTIRRVEAF